MIKHTSHYQFILYVKSCPKRRVMGNYTGNIFFQSNVTNTDSWIYCTWQVNNFCIRQKIMPCNVKVEIKALIYYVKHQRVASCVFLWCSVIKDMPVLH